jgi:hypothetical protein
LIKGKDELLAGGSAGSDSVIKAIRDAVWVDGPLRTTEEAAREVIEKFFPARARER